MRFIMTGHKGLIGSFLLRELVKQGHTPVLLIDMRDEENPRDIRQIDKYTSDDLGPVDMFIHLASFCKINKCVENPELAFENNVVGTFKVLEFCRKNKIPKIIFTSSSRVLNHEKNSYTASKLFGEELVKGYFQSYGIKYIIIRPSTVYGPFDDHTKRLVDIWVLNALKNKELKIFGEPEKTLDFTYIDDFVKAMLLAMNEDNKEFNIAGGKGIKLAYVADFIINLAGQGHRNFYNAEKTQPQLVEVDISAIKDLGWLPKTSIEEGLTKTFNWYKENLDKINR